MAGTAVARGCGAIMANPENAQRCGNSNIRRDYMSLEESIKNEIRLLSKGALEKPNENYNNMPACPFAKRAWADDRVGFVFKR